MKIVEAYQTFYVKYHKILLYIPIIATVLALFVIGMHYQQTGDIMNKDVSLKGGITATVYTQQPINFQDLEQQLRTVFSDVDVKKLAEFGNDQAIGAIIEADTQDEKLLTQTLEQALKIKLTEDIYSIEVVGSSLGSSFYKQMLTAILFAFLFMGIVVFFIYKSIIPSLAVIGAAFADIVITLAIIDIIGMKMSTAAISALLLLIGYSVDSDILQTTKMLKRTGETVEKRMFDSMKTTLTMSIAAIATLLVGYLISTSLIIKEMFLIMLIGLIVDAFYTYWTNSGILLNYVEKHQHHG
ncbi:MAG: hypothetical protein Q7R96_02630 [Nanoarchaeota archaeon]|nr:hypothetical protein [Nanoarchaeota archaeon]